MSQLFLLLYFELEFVFLGIKSLLFIKRILNTNKMWQDTQIRFDSGQKELAYPKYEVEFFKADYVED
jgi:hypothetical protein